MIIEVRCLICGQVVNHKWLPFIEFQKQGMSPHEALNKVDAKRPCCRSTLLTHVNLIDTKLRNAQIREDERTVSATEQAEPNPRPPRRRSTPRTYQAR